MSEKDHRTLRYDERYLRGIECFNNGEYFAAHDLLEEVWRETADESKRFLQGLVQLAVAMFHHTRGNAHGAKREFQFATENLSAYRGTYLGVQAGRALSEVARALSDQAGPPVILVDGRRPHVKLKHDPKLVAAVEAFNAGRFEEARLAFLELAKDDDDRTRDLFLWLAACAETMLDRSNYPRARRLLNALPDQHLGIDVVEFSGAMEREARPKIRLR